MIGIAAVNTRSGLSRTMSLPAQSQREVLFCNRRDGNQLCQEVTCKLHFGQVGKASDRNLVPASVLALLTGICPRLRI